MTSSDAAFNDIRLRVDAAAGRAGHRVRLLAVGKTKPAAAIRSLARLGQREFGENYVQEALAKRRELADQSLVWHLIGPLQSNKCRDVAENLDWLQSLDREKLIAPLDRYRPAEFAPLNVLIQVNIDDEASKSGCAPHAIGALAEKISLARRLRLRGLMAIGAPHADLALRRAAFRRMHALFDDLRASYPDIDTLSLGMSEDFELAIEEGATLVRVGTALFGSRTAADPRQQ